MGGALAKPIGLLRVHADAMGIAALHPSYGLILQSYSTTQGHVFGMTPKFVYLDTNDFSDLSEPESRLKEADKVILEALRKARSSGRATFFISPIHISEAVHASETHKEDAVRRATLMRELGGENFLRFPVDICKIELARIFAGEEHARCSIEEITSKPNEWFGTAIPTEGLTDRRKEVSEAIENALQGLNRKDRRRRRSELDLKKKSSHTIIRSLFKEGLRNSPPNNIPVSLMNPDLALDWYLGTATDTEFRSHSVQLLSDPYLLFKHFVDELGHREQLYNIVRDQGLKWSELIEIGMSQMAPILAEAKKRNTPVDLRSTISQITSGAFWQKVVGSLAEADLAHLSEREIIEAKEKSPSTSVFIHAVLESVFVRLQSTQARVAGGNLQPAQVKISDYADFMHAIYAPYFDVFRCDTRFGAVLRSHPATRGKIASKRGDLINML
jgi:hypothetical protein